MKGTILLSTEGINLFVAGSGESIGCLLGRLREIPGLEGLEPKVSYSESQPFNRMLVRLKRPSTSHKRRAGVKPPREIATTRSGLKPEARIFAHNASVKSDIASVDTNSHRSVSAIVITSWERSGNK